MGDINILAPSDRRRIWTAREKATLLAEVDAEGGKVRLVARRHNISESLIYNWRSARKAAAIALGASENVEFVLAGVIDGPGSRAPAMLTPPDVESEPTPVPIQAERQTGCIEITLPNGTRVNVDATVNERALGRVLRAMKGLT